MMPALELIDKYPDLSDESTWSLWLDRPGWWAVCYLHADGHISGTTVWVDGVAWPVEVRP